jgi:hypothetical protein
MSILKWMIGCVLAVSLAWGVSGCNSSSDSSGSGSSLDDLARATDAQKASRQQQDADAAAQKAEVDKKAAEQASAQPAEPQKRVAGRAPVAPGGGYYNAIIGARRHILNESESWAWKQGVSHFRAETGRKPKDNKEFVEKVLKEKDIQLPKLEDNEEYVYDPKGETDGDFGQLYVIEKQPAQGSTPPTNGTPAAK